MPVAPFSVSTERESLSYTQSSPPSSVEVMISGLPNFSSTDSMESPCLIVCAAPSPGDSAEGLDRSREIAVGLDMQPLKITRIMVIKAISFERNFIYFTLLLWVTGKALNQNFTLPIMAASRKRASSNEIVQFFSTDSPRAQSTMERPLFASQRATMFLNSRTN